MTRQSARVRPAPCSVLAGGLGIAVLLCLALPVPGDPPAPAPASPEAGRLAYERHCASCHGVDARSTGTAGTPIPMLARPDALECAEDDYYRFRIAAGHGVRRPPSGAASSPPLGRDEIDGIVAHVRGREGPGASVADVLAASGDGRRGKGLYRGLCAGCHGTKGQGGIGSRLASTTFLAIASDAFLAETIVNGRPGTAMKSWKQLSAGSVADLIAFLRAGTPARPGYDEVAAARVAAPPAEMEAEGARLFRVRCEACHGPEGRGGIAPRLRSPDFLQVADDRFLYRTITEGRPGTAMPAGPDLSVRELAALLAYLRSGAPAGSEPPPISWGPEDEAKGEALYLARCLGCHGAEGEGGRSTQLANPAFQRAVSDGMLGAWILRDRCGVRRANPAPATPEATPVRPEDLPGLVSYLRAVGRRERPPFLHTARGDARAGAEIYEASCAPCHGSDGTEVRTSQLSNPAFLRSASDGFLTATIVLGREGTDMSAQVTTEEHLIEPEQIADVIAFLRQWEQPSAWRTPARGVEVTEQSVAAGREHYARYCAACHGGRGKGSQEGPPYFAPALNDPAFLAAASDGFLLATIARGRSGTPMRPFGLGAGGIAELEPTVLSEIVAYLRSWQGGK